MRGASFQPTVRRNIAETTVLAGVTQMESIGGQYVGQC